MAKKNKSELLVILDTHAILHRAYHALPAFSSKGEPTGALYGLASFIIKIIRELEPDYLAAAYDLPEPTFRHAAYEKYKIQRPKLDSDLAVQITRARDLLEAFSIPMYEHKGFEADDIIGTIAKKTSKVKNLNVIIASGDLDTLQLVDGRRVRVYTLKSGLSETVLYDEEKVRERFGFDPIKLPDFKGLRGDPSDNIKGVPGIGEKTASELIQKFGTIEDIYKSLKKDRKKGVIPGMKARTALLLEEHEEDARFSKTLAEIRRDAPVEFSLDHARFKSRFVKGKAGEVMKELGFLSLIPRLPEDENGEVAEGEAATITAIEEKKDALRGAGDIWWSADADGGGVFAVTKDGKVYSFLIDKITEASKFLGGSARHHFFDAKKVFHRINVVESIPQVRSDIKISASLSRPELQNLTLVDAVQAFLPQEHLGQTPYLRALSCLPKLEEAVAKEASEKNLEKILSDIEIPLIPVLVEMERRGVLMDMNLLRKLSREFGRRLRGLEENIWKLAGTSFNVSSPKQLSEIIFGKLNLFAPGLKKTAKGVPSTRESELLKLKDRHPIVPEILSFRELSKLKSTYIDALPKLADVDGRVHTTFDQTGAVTGRLSSAEPNLQNIPIRSEFGRMVRAVFIAAPGFELASFDYSQLELRIAAILSGDKKMQFAFREGRDIHIETASEIFNVPPDKVTENMRREAKTINFGILYGMGASALSQSLGIPRSEAERFLEEYFRDFSGVRKFLEHTKEQAHKNGFVETAYGRRRYLPEIYSKAEFIRSEAERMAINAPIQGTAADIVKLAMVRGHDFIKKTYPKGSAHLLVQIHDELLFEVKKGIVGEFISPMRSILESIYQSSVPLTVEAKSGINWADMHKVSRF